MPNLDAPILLLIFDALLALTLAVWLGTMAFLSFGVAPVIFRVLDPAAASKIVRGVFPVYYKWGVACATLALPCVVCRALCFPEVRGPGVAIQSGLVLVGLFASLYGLTPLSPRINAARDGGEAKKAEFERLHRRSVRLNLMVMLIVGGLLVTFTARPAPQSSGIEEYSPQQRAAYDLEFFLRLMTPKSRWKDHVETPPPGGKAISDPDSGPASQPPDLSGPAARP